jgi:hypothetical protein
MKKQTRRFRQLYFICFALIFAISVPLVVLYSLGYRVGQGFRPVKTGGLMVAQVPVRADVYLDSVLIDSASFFKSQVFVSGLTPKTYEVKVVKEGSLTWNKTVKVKEQKVSLEPVFLIPENLELVEIPQFELVTVSTTTQSVGQGTTTPKVQKRVATSSPLVREEYLTIKNLFATTTATTTVALKGVGATSSTTTLPTILARKDGVVIFERGDTLIARFEESLESAPEQFFDESGVPAREIVLGRVFASAREVTFLPKRLDVVLITLPSGVYIQDVRTNPVHVLVPLYEVPGSHVRLDDEGRLFLKDGDKLFSFEL